MDGEPFLIKKSLNRLIASILKLKQKTALILQKIKRILVPMDGSKISFKALGTAIELARTCRAEILAIHAVSLVLAEFMPTIPYKKSLKKKAGKFMEKSKYLAAKKGVLFNYAIVFGDPVYEIIKISNSKKPDIIVMGAHGKGRIAEMFFGSVSNAILHKSKVPVLIVK